MFKLIICAISALFLVACASKEITQTKTETTLELGSECTIIPTDYFELGSKVNPDTIAVDTSAVDTNTVGEYVAVVTYNDSTYEIKVSVSDTTAPEISAKADITPVDRGTTIYPADYVEVNDLSEVAVYFVAEDGDNESLEIPSDLDNDVTEINYTVVAVDAESNRSEELSVAIPIFTFKQGEIEGEALPLEEEPTEVDESTEEAEEIELLEHTVEPVEGYDIITPEEALARGISPYAGKTSKHGWIYPDDYVEYGPRYEDHISDTEMMFDMGLLDEAEYQELLKMYKEKNGTAETETTTTPESTQSGTSAITSDAALDYILKKVPSHEPSTGNTGSTTPSTGGGSSNPPGTPGYDPATYYPEGNTYEPDGVICY